MKLSGIHIAGIIAGIVIVGIAVYATNETDSATEPEIIIKANPEIDFHNTDADLTAQEKSAIKLVQNYKGEDNSGDSIVSVIGKIISSQYSNDVIYDSDTKLGWGAYTDSDDPNLLGVMFTFESENDNFSFLWLVDSTTNAIYTAGGGADEILDIVNSN